MSLLGVLLDVRALVARPDNDFSWSSWPDREAALAELDAAIARIRSGGGVPAGLAVVFAPTGPLQELAISSGWGDEFVALADRFDDALG